MYKTAISLEFATRRERDTFLKALQGLFYGLGYAAKGKVRVSAEVELDNLGFLPLFPFGIELPEPKPTPIEQASYATEAAERIADDVPLDEALEDQAFAANDAREAIAVEEEAPADELAEEEHPEPEAQADDGGDNSDDEPRTPFDRMLGRELPSDDDEGD
jgi:hypothetical protein